MPRATALRTMDRVHLETWLVPLEVRCMGILTCQLSLGGPTGMSGPTCVLGSGRASPHDLLPHLLAEGPS